MQKTYHRRHNITPEQRQKVLEIRKRRQRDDQERRRRYYQKRATKEAMP